METVYVCRVCAAHIALPDDFQYCFTLKGMTGGVFQNLTNVHLNDPTNYQIIGDHTVTNVLCNTCSSHLGCKFIEVPNSEGGPSKEDFHIPLTTLLMWDGYHFLDAQTEEELMVADTTSFLNIYKNDQKNRLKVPISYSVSSNLVNSVMNVNS